jgi:two-component system chemotaxis response regulator CheY
MRVLVIDDSRAMRAILRQMLGGVGFEVAEAADGREGLRRLREGAPPDLVVVDWNMPVLDGLGFVKELRADGAYAALPVLMVTTETEMGRMAEALEAGASEYVMKPFTREDLLSKLDLLGLAPA